MQQAGVVAREFLDAVNAHDVGTLREMMTDDHEFTDAMDNGVHGREAAAHAWMALFALLPDYSFTLDRLLVDGDHCALFGRAHGHLSGVPVPGEERWDIACAVQVVHRFGHVAAWRIYCDNEPLRRTKARRAARVIV